MPDFGILPALSGQSPWATIRAEKQRELQLVAMQNAMAENELQKQQQSGAAIQEYMATVSQIKALEPDMEKVRAKNAELVSTIEEGVKKHHGNVKKYLLSGGMNELAKYRRNLLESKEVQTALINAYNHNRYIADVSAGLNPRKVSWKGPNGDITTGRYEDQYQAYTKGEVPTLDYRGGYKRANYDAATHFGAQYGQDRYRREAVSPKALYRYIFEAAKKEGMSDIDAHDQATNDTDQYVSSVTGGANPFVYKWEDPMQKRLIQAKIAKLSGGGKDSSGLDWLYATMATHPFDPKRRFVPEDGVTEIKGADFGQVNYNMGHELSKGIVNALGYGLDDNGSISNKNSAIARNNLYVGNDKLDISTLKEENIKGLQPTGRLVKVYDKKGNLVNGIEYALRVNEPGVEKLKYKGQDVSGAISDKKIPLGEYEDNDGFGWLGMAKDDYHLTLRVVEPLPNTPQFFEEYRREMQRNSPSGMRGTVAGFQYSDALNDAIIDEGDALLQ